MRVLLPLLQSIFLDEEVAANKEGIDNNTNAAANNANANTTANIAVPDNNNYATMPPKVKPLPPKTTKKDISACCCKASSPCRSCRNLLLR